MTSSTQEHAKTEVMHSSIRPSKYESAVPTIGSKWVVLWSLWAARLVPQWSQPVRVSGGWLVGEHAPDMSHTRYLSIPYASYRRYRAPGPQPSWDGVFKANREHIRCPQRFPVITEECLILNVYSPLPTKRKLPVMVFFHGGAFYEGSGGKLIYGAKHLIKHDVILVTVNYRLGIEGFLSLGIKEAPGNAGLKDQVAALKWIQRNIYAFHGDENNITIFGESAGAASVSYHLLSPMSKGLFHKAIIQSGSSLSPWAIQPRPLATAMSQANVMGYKTSDPYQLYRIFNNHTKSELMANHVPRKKGSTMLGDFVFVPCIERKIDGVEHFLSAHPYDLLSEGRFNNVPIMMGTNAEEGSLFINADTLIKNATAFDSIPRNLLVSQKDKAEILPRINDVYTGNNQTNIEESLKVFSEFESDVNFRFPLQMEMDLILKFNTQPVYYYIYNYECWKSITKLFLWLFGNRRPTKRAVHGDDLFNIFSQEWLPDLFDIEMINRMTSMWTNFAKYSDPTPFVSATLPVKWRPVGKERKWMAIDVVMGEEPARDTESFALWKEIYDKYRYIGSKGAQIP